MGRKPENAENILQFPAELYFLTREIINNLYKNMEKLENKLKTARKIEDFEEKAIYYKEEIIMSMNELRKDVDSLELIIPKDMWPMPTYSDIFLED